MGSAERNVKDICDVSITTAECIFQSISRFRALLRFPDVSQHGHLGFRSVCAASCLWNDSNPGINFVCTSRVCRLECVFNLFTLVFYYSQKRSVALKFIISEGECSCVTLSFGVISPVLVVKRFILFCF